MNEAVDRFIVIIDSGFCPLDIDKTFLGVPLAYLIFAELLSDRHIEIIEHANLGGHKRVGNLSITDYQICCRVHPTVGDHASSRAAKMEGSIIKASFAV